MECPFFRHIFFLVLPHPAPLPRPLLEASLTLLGLEGILCPWPSPCRFLWSLWSALPAYYFAHSQVCVLLEAGPSWGVSLTQHKRCCSPSPEKLRHRLSFPAASNSTSHLHKQRIWLCSQAQSHRTFEHCREQRKYRLFCAKSDFSLLVKK